jgi:hypothetical protein
LKLPNSPRMHQTGSVVIDNALRVMWEEIARAVNNNATAGTLSGFVDSEIPVGVINGVNTVFGLASAPTPALSLMLFLNGLLQTAGGVDYTLAGATITYVAAPAAISKHIAWYRT